MKIEVDWDLCDGNGLCTIEAPEVFELDDEDNLHVLTAEPDESLHEKVRQAAFICPKAAIRLHE
jgi:ferredoxin